MKKELTGQELQAVKQVRESAGDASRGLPEEIFELASSIVPMINVDLFCRDSKGRILMIWREDPICGCGWHIPGGIIRFKETAEERIQKTAKNELGVSVQHEAEPMEINQFILPQDVRGHFISLLYRCFLPADFPDYPEADPQKSCRAGEIRWHSVCPRHWVTGQERAYGSLFDTSPGGVSSTVEKVKRGDCTFVFDIDGVVARFDPALRYGQARPAGDVISIINRLHDYGNKIILFTARGSETGIDWSETTEKQMRDWGVKYHQLRFGKPAATFYVDDKNLSLSELAELAGHIGVSPRNLTCAGRKGE